MATPLKSLSSWATIRSIPYYFFYYYVPTRYSGLSSESDHIRQEVWKFKDGYHQDQFVDQLATKLSNTFGNADFLTLVCIPASTVNSNRTRYEQFSHDLCSKIHMTNGFEHISIVKEKKPSHLGGTDEAVYELDRSFFAGKKIVLFDDVVTKGSSMQSFIDYLEEVGAKVVCCMSIGRTFWDKCLSYQITNPWTGKAVFSGKASTAPDKDNRAYETPISLVDELLSSNTTVKRTITPTVIAKPSPAQKVATDNTVNEELTVAHNNVKSTSAPTVIAKTSPTQKVATDNAFDKAILKKIFDKEQHNAKYKLGEFVRFGHLNGRSVQWIVLDQKDDEYLLISKYGLDCREFHTTNTFITWDKCSLRTWLNVDFYNSTFSNKEKSQIIQHEVIASSNPIYRTYQGQNTKDKLFILNISEYNKYFDIYNKWVCRLFSGILRQCWLRNSGNDSCHASFIGRSGSIHAGGSKITSARNAVRPVMWVKL